MLMAGADVTMLCSALLRHGVRQIGVIERDLIAWMEEHEYESVTQLKGSLSQKNCPDPSAFERAQYMRAISQYAAANPSSARRELRPARNGAPVSDPAHCGELGWTVARPRGPALRAWQIVPPFVRIVPVVCYEAQTCERNEETLRSSRPVVALLCLPPDQAAVAAPAVQASGDRPNILWLVSEDNGPFLGCYGDPLARTPTLDAWPAGACCSSAVSPSRFARPRGSRSSPGCTPSPAVRREHMRAQGKIPSWLKGFPAYLRKAGYYTSNNAKTDYNSPINIEGGVGRIEQERPLAQAARPEAAVLQRVQPRGHPRELPLPGGGAANSTSRPWTPPRCASRPTSRTRPRCAPTGCGITTT